MRLACGEPRERRQSTTIKTRIAPPATAAPIHQDPNRPAPAAGTAAAFCACGGGTVADAEGDEEGPWSRAGFAGVRSPSATATSEDGLALGCAEGKAGTLVAGESEAI